MTNGKIRSGGTTSQPGEAKAEEGKKAQGEPQKGGGVNRSEANDDVWVKNHGAPSSKEDLPRNEPNRVRSPAPEANKGVALGRTEASARGQKNVQPGIDPALGAPDTNAEIRVLSEDIIPVGVDHIIKRFKVISFAPVELSGVVERTEISGAGGCAWWVNISEEFSRYFDGFLTLANFSSEVDTSKPSGNNTNNGHHTTISFFPTGSPETRMSKAGINTRDAATLTLNKLVLYYDNDSAHAQPIGGAFVATFDEEFDTKFQDARKSDMTRGLEHITFCTHPSLPRLSVVYSNDALALYYNEKNGAGYDYNYDKIAHDLKEWGKHKESQ